MISVFMRGADVSLLVRNERFAHGVLPILVGSGQL